MAGMLAYLILLIKISPTGWMRPYDFAPGCRVEFQTDGWRIGNKVLLHSANPQSPESSLSFHFPGAL
jgi:hypothetical protein